jgi:CheY-like chemotaxis protein
MKKKILVVDDEAYMHKLLQHHLERAGFEMVSARTGVEALEVAAREMPQLIVMDIMLPQMDGLTAIKHLKASDQTKSVPIIVITANTHVVSKHEAESSGATLFLTKPFSPAQLLGEIQRLVSEAKE